MLKICQRWSVLWSRSVQCWTISNFKWFVSNDLFQMILQGDRWNVSVSINSTERRSNEMNSDSTVNYKKRRVVGEAGLFYRGNRPSQPNLSEMPMETFLVSALSTQRSGRPISGIYYFFINTCAFRTGIFIGESELINKLFIEQCSIRRRPGWLLTTVYTSSSL